jgi:hypothetical protein
VDKLGQRIFDTGHGTYATACINGTKKNPCALGDILGDWREEIVMRSSDNRYIRVYTTVTPTEHRMQSLWYDHQYRQAMVWQTEGYNQPPHPSFFVGELEGFTQAPPAATWTGRTGIGNNGSITTTLNGKDVFVWPDGNGSEYSVNINSGAQPSTLFLNSRTTIEGGDLPQYTETKHTWDRIRLTGNGLSGTTNLCKQGGSAAHLPYKTHTHSGKTDVWQGALICNGSITNSDIWANRFTELFLGSDLVASESQYKSIAMEYGSALYITSNLKSTPYVNDNGYAHMTVNSLTIKEGSRLVFDINGSANTNGDRLNIRSLFVRTQDWQYGPEYLVPVIDIRSNGALADGDYLLGTLQEMAEGSASLLDVRVECTAQVNGHFGTVFYNEANKSYYLHVGTAIDASYQIDNSVYLDVFVQNFEDTDWFDNWTIALGNRLTAVQQANSASGSKSIWLKSVLDANNGTSATFTLPAIAEYANTTVYEFDFDFAQTSIIGSNADRAGEFIIRDENNGAIATFRAFTGATTGEIVVNGNVVGNYTVTKGTYFKSETAPTISHHVSLHSSAAGTILSIDGTAINIGSSFVKVGSIIYNTNRYAGQLQFDNIKLNCKIVGSYEIAVNNGGFDGNNNTGWSGTAFAFQSYTDAEHYNKNFDTYQTLTGIPNGWYILAVNGFYRNGSNDNGTNKLATLYANDATQAVRLRSSIGLSDLQAATGLTAYPNNMRDAETAFAAGLYENILRVYVSNGTLRFGVRKSTAKTSDWAIFDNFRLYYVGNSNALARSTFDEATGIDDVKTVANPVAYYTLDGRRTIVPEVGRVYIVKMTDGTSRKIKY